MIKFFYINIELLLLFYVAKDKYWTTRIDKSNVFRYENTLAEKIPNT